MTRALQTEMAAADPGTEAASPRPLAMLRGEIDALDDALHDLLMRRAEVVARLAGSPAKARGAKAGGAKAGEATSPLRPGREAMIIRRLLARHAGPLPIPALLRLWREIFAISTAMQDSFAVAVCSRGADQARLARQHFGSLTPMRSHPTPSRALAAVAAGEAQVAVLPLPEEGEAPEAAWWTGLDSPRLQVVARLPFWSPGHGGALGGGAAGPEALAVALGAPDPSGADRTLLRLETRSEAGAERSRAGILDALTGAGLVDLQAPRLLQLHRDAGRLRVLAEVDGMLAAADPRLAALSVDHAQPLGGYAVPLRDAERGEQDR